MEATPSINSSRTTSFRLRSPSLNSVRLQRVFDLFDKNGDGIITVAELSQALSTLGLDAEFSELESTIKSFIREGNGGLDFDDFTALHRSLDEAFFGGIYPQETAESDSEAVKKQEEADLTEAFKVFDENGDGYISAKELQTVLKKLGLAEGGQMDRVEKMIGSVDRNNDGRVDFFEFKDMMRNVIIQSS